MDRSSCECFFVGCLESDIVTQTLILNRLIFLVLVFGLMPGTAKGTRGHSAGETPRGLPHAGHIISMLNLKYAKAKICYS